MPQLGCHSESTVTACEPTASKPKKRKKEEVPGEKPFGLFGGGFFRDGFAVFCVSLHLSEYGNNVCYVFSPKKVLSSIHDSLSSGAKGWFFWPGIRSNQTLLLLLYMSFSP